MTVDNPKATEFTLQELQSSASESELNALAKQLQQIVANIRQRIVSDKRLNDRLRGNETLTSDDDSRNQAPEEFTKDILIDELLDYLGYPYSPTEVNTPADDDDQWVDYSVSLSGYPNIDSTQLLIEAEPINKNLDQRKHGIGQVRGWLHHEPFESDLGIATDGLEWVLLKNDPDTHAITEIEHCNLTEVFIAFFEDLATGRSDATEVLTDEHYTLLGTFYRAFSFDNFTDIAPGVQSIIRRKKSEISDAFYEEYIEIVFGIIDETTDGRDTERCLVGNGINAPTGTPDEKRRLFAVQLMNRLIFIKFVEDTELVADGLLEDIRTRHEEGGHLNDCYTSFLKPLIYDVFNTPKGSSRPDSVNNDALYRDIPYLNGGLFRENLDAEKEYMVADSILLEILGMLEDYQFSVAGKPDDLDPSILGTVFEKTINYLAGEEGEQKDLGAYYTPDSITQFCSRRSVKADLLERFKQTLAEEWEWRKGELARYDDIYALIDALSPNQEMVEDLLADVDTFHVLDPACGSGHFLTSVLHEIVPIRRALYEKHVQSPHPHQLKKKTVLENLYGVDINGPGVEITKLRLWLSIISEISLRDVDELDRGELALPNVAFNIREGNSLIGYTDTDRLQIEDDDSGTQQSYLEEFGSESVKALVEERQEQISRYKTLYGEDAHEIEEDINENDKRYNQQLNQKLVSDLRDAGVSFKHEMDEITAPDLPSDALEKVTIRFDTPLDDARKDELDERFRTHKGMRINAGKEGYVSITLSHRYLTGTPEARLAKLIEEVASNVATLKIGRYLTVRDVEELEYIHWPLEFYEVFDSGGFDVIISNPPYGIDLTDAESALGDYTDENHSSMVFSTRSEELADNDGRVAFVVPKVLTYAYSWTDARKHLLDRNLNYLIDLREAFDGVKQEQMILMFSGGDTVEESVVVGRRQSGTNGNEEEFFEQEYRQSAFDSDGFFMWVDDDNEDLLSKLSDYDTFDDVDFAEATKGMDDFKNSLTSDPDDFLAYRGDDVGQFRFVGQSYLDPNIKHRSDFHLTGHGKQKVVFQRILAHVTNPVDRIIIQCAIDYEGACVPDTAIHAIPEETSLELLCGLLNSSLFAWYAYNRIYNRAIRSMDLTPIYFGRLPAPPEMDDELIETVESRTEEIQSMDGGNEEDLLKTYDRLNEAVYDLYQLSEEERELVNRDVPSHEETLLRQ